MKLILVCCNIVLAVIFSNSIIINSAELQNSVILDNSTNEITIWNSEIPLSLDFLFESVGNGSVQVTFVVQNSPNFIFTIQSGVNGSSAVPNVINVSLLLITNSELNPNITIYWEFMENTIIPLTTSQNDPNFDLGLDSKLPIIGAVIGALAIFILGFIYGSQIYKKRKYHGDDLYPSVFEENEKS